MTVRSGEVLWEGLDLLRAAAVFLETPVYSWPQPGAVRGLPSDPAARSRHLGADREARALAHSALCIVGAARPVINPPETSFLAAAPAVALDRLAAGGTAVHPWSLSPAPDRASAAGRIVFDAAGRDRFHRPSRPPAGEHALVLDHVAGSVTTFLVAGGRIAGARRHASGEGWAEGSPGETLRGSAIDSAAADLASRAAGSLGLRLAAVSMEERSALRILFVEAGPDLAGWDAALNQSLAGTLAEFLIASAREREGGAR